MTDTAPCRLGCYFVASFIVAMALQLTGAWLRSIAGAEVLGVVPSWLSLATPFLVALGILVGTADTALLREFLRRLFDVRRISPQTIRVFVFLMPLVVITAALVSLPFGGSIYQFQPAWEELSRSVIPLHSTGVTNRLFLTAAAAITIEEIGWRAYLFPGLHGRYRLLTASLILSGCIAVWHVPYVFIPDSYYHDAFQRDAWFAVGAIVRLVPISFISSWLYAKNGESIVAAVLFRCIAVVSQGMLTLGHTARTIETVVLLLVGVGITAMDRDLFLERPNERETKQYDFV